MDDGGRGDTRGALRVLFVDDYPEYLEAGEEYLETVDDDITVLPETRAASAIERLSEERVDCVVCDYEMPEMSGLELLESARAERPEVPFIVLTGHEPGHVASRVEEEATAVLQKGSGTTTFEELRTLIRAHVRTESEYSIDNILG